jgi:beta-lactamase class A
LYGKEESRPNIFRDKNKNFVFTSPILDYEELSQMTSSSLGYNSFNKMTHSLAEKYGLSGFSVYFRDLNDGQWVGVNEKDAFSPASLMKTPLLIAFLKNVERDPSLLNKKMIADEKYFKLATPQNFEVNNKIRQGQTYTLREVIEVMIEDSDNVAATMIFEHIREEDFSSLLRAVGVFEGGESYNSDIRVKDFASFFRILYNASYLNREMSEFALSIFAKSNFNQGISAGLPNSVIVANKYGERTLGQKINEKTTIARERQVHDCGIIYNDKNPYILCVMTKGNDFTKQLSFIKEISSYTYKNINN